MKTFFAVLMGFTLCVSAQAASGWVQLFDGKSLDGWVAKGGKAKYEIENGVIVGTTVEGSKNTFLSTKRDYADFELVVDVLCDKELNSGIQIRSHTYEKPTPQASKAGKMRDTGEVYGYQCEVTTADKCVSGNFWDEGRWTKWHDDLTKKPGACAAFKDGQWNTYRIVAQGDRIRSWVNGVPCADFRDTLDASGFIGLQVHSVGAGKGPFQVRFKNIKLRELKPSDKIN
jgi:hypothetical protein